MAHINAAASYWCHWSSDGAGLPLTTLTCVALKNKKLGIPSPL